MNNNIENIEKEQEKPRSRTRKLENLRFDSITDARESMAKMTLSYVNGEISEHQLRAFTYAINSLGKLLLHEKTEALEQRIKDLERARKT